ncbi:hypothetical protein DOY81_012718, partial [Sarcophaga bullata]
TLQETGVTNKVFESKLNSHLSRGFDPFKTLFESKLNSHLSRGFDPFKTLSINTNTVESSSAPGNVTMMKKPSVLYDSLQHHPLHQMQVQQQQHSQLYQQTSMAPKTTIVPIATVAAVNTSTCTSAATAPATTISTTTTNQASASSVVDGHRFSRMEIHKASLATTTIDHQTNSKVLKSKSTDVNEKPTALTDIAESGTSSTTSTRGTNALRNIIQHNIKTDNLNFMF